VSGPKRVNRKKIEFRQERRALTLSGFVGLAFAISGIAIGVIAGSQIILFDGFYTFLGIFLTWMAMRVSKLVEVGPTERYPYGREALVPLIIGIEGVALLATCAYAVFDAIMSIIRGGTAAPTTWGLVYATASVVVPLYIWWQLRRIAAKSELVRAEALQWLSGAGLGVAICVAFVVARLVVGTTWSPLSHYVDPSLVIVACFIFVGPPAGMVRTTFIELIEGSPDENLVETAEFALTEVATAFGLDDRHMRMTKIGRKFYVEIDFVVPITWTVAQSDDVRRMLFAKLKAIPHDLWLTLEFTADRALVA
jgi:predicted Co/Zn/Cd cation transporter (cation efflux family)